MDFPQKGRDRVSEGLPDSAPEPGHADDAPSDAVRFQSQLLGHASINITLDTYSHVIEGMDGGLADAMDEAL